MLKVELIGNLGADAEIKESQGSKFVTMRVANSIKYRKEDGTDVERTDWIDATMNNTDAKIIPFLKAGVKVFIRGNATLRVYSSPKDRCMKAGLSVAVSEIELCGGTSDAVPRELIEAESGILHRVDKYYQVPTLANTLKKGQEAFLVDKRMNQYRVIPGGWVAPVIPEEQAQQAEETK